MLMMSEAKRASFIKNMVSIMMDGVHRDIDTLKETLDTMIPGVSFEYRVAERLWFYSMTDMEAFGKILKEVAFLVHMVHKARPCVITTKDMAVIFMANGGVPKDPSENAFKDIP
jgi:hypothetical protein